MNYQYLFLIKKSLDFTDIEREFLSRLLFNSVYKDNISLNRAILELLLFTKLKKSFYADKSKSRLLIYYSSPNSISHLYTDLVQILDAKEDKYD